MADKRMIRYWFFEIVAALFILLFLYTAITKLAAIDRFIYIIQTVPAMKPYAHLLGWGIPITELVICTLLFIPAMRRIGLGAATLLMIGFTAYIARMMVTMSKLPCSCGGIINSMGWKDHLIFNSTFVALGIFAILLHPKSLLMTNRNSRTPAKKVGNIHSLKF